MQYEEEWKVYNDYFNTLDFAEQKGIQKGIEQGIKQGIKQGEKKKSIEIAKKGILKGLDNETIMDLTELSIEEIELIRKEMSLN